MCEGGGVRRRRVAPSLGSVHPSFPLLSGSLSRVEKGGKEADVSGVSNERERERERGGERGLGVVLPFTSIRQTT